MLGLAVLAIIQYPDIRVRPASRPLKKGSIEKGQSPIHHGKVLEVKYVRYILTSHRPILLVPSRLT